jgi:CDP-diacylglycerol--glycerol-3-phosphate 3-phosphatidyltransferase
MVLPNQLTVMRIVLTPIYLWLFLSDDVTMNIAGVVVFVIAALTDWYDGWLARKYNYITDWGKFLDPLADKILTSTAFIGFVVIGKLELWMVLIIIFRDFFITGVRIYAEFKQIAFKTSFIAKIKTFVQMVFLYLLLVVYLLDKLNIDSSIIRDILLFFDNTKVIYWTMLSITLLTLYTLIDYFVYNKTLLQTLKKNETE